jgi:hypothetical protein
MTHPQITRTFSHTPSSIMLGKARHFLKRSLWRYIFAALLVTAGIQLSQQRDLFTGTTLYYFLGVTFTLLLLSLLVMFVSTLILAQTMKSKNMAVSFSQDEITIRYENTGVEETKNWNWILSSEETKRFYFFDVSLAPRYGLVLSKSKFTDEEKELFNKWLVVNGKAVK